MVDYAGFVDLSKACGPQDEEDACGFDCKMLSAVPPRKIEWPGHFGTFDFSSEATKAEREFVHISVPPAFFKTREECEEQADDWCSTTADDIQEGKENNLVEQSPPKEKWQHRDPKSKKLTSTIALSTDEKQLYVGANGNIAFFPWLDSFTKECSDEVESRNTIRALDVANGEQVWEIETTGPVMTNPIVSPVDGTIIVVVGDCGRLEVEGSTSCYCLDGEHSLLGLAENGTKKWAYPGNVAEDKVDRGDGPRRRRKLMFSFDFGSNDDFLGSLFGDTGTTGDYNGDSSSVAGVCDPAACLYADDGECDEPDYCTIGTDGNDCNRIDDDGCLSDKDSYLNNEYVFLAIPKKKKLAVSLCLCLRNIICVRACFFTILY